jgi:hypothetical protein
VTAAGRGARASLDRVRCSLPDRNTIEESVRGRRRENLVSRRSLQHVNNEGDGMRVAVICPPRSAAPFEAGPMLMEALGQQVETYPVPI